MGHLDSRHGDCCYYGDGDYDYVDNEYVYYGSNDYYNRKYGYDKKWWRWCKESNVMLMIIIMMIITIRQQKHDFKNKKLCMIKQNKTETKQNEIKIKVRTKWNRNKVN